jgi:hypothetical protein
MVKEIARRSATKKKKDEIVKSISVLLASIKKSIPFAKIF